MTESAAGSALDLRYLTKRYVIDEHLKTRFMMPKEIKLEIIFDIAISRPKRLNDGKGLPGNQWNLEEALIF